MNLDESLVGKPKSKRVFYLDALRAVAIIAVITFHIFQLTRNFVYGEALFHSLSWFLNDFMGVCCRVGVLLFLMLAGSLSLGRNWTLKKFLGRRLPRIVIPFAIWGFVIATIICCFVWFYPGSSSMLSQYSLNKLTYLGNPSLMNYLNYLYSFYMANELGSTAYWFFWMILGTYLIMPIFDKWVYSSKLTDLEYFLFFWLITCIFDFTLGYKFPIKLTYFVSPIGLVVAGYYLRYTERKFFNNPYVAILILLAGMIANFACSYYWSTPDEIFKFNRYSIFNTLEVIGIFLLFKNFDKFNIHIKFFENPEGIFKKFVYLLAKNSYGIYLIQDFIIVVIYEVIMYFNIFPNINGTAMIFLLISSIVVSTAIIELLSHIPGLGKIIGSK